MAMVDVKVQIVVERPRHTVAEYSSDPDNATAWYANITAVQWETPKPASLGSRFAFTAHFLGRELNYTYEVTAGTRLPFCDAHRPGAIPDGDDLQLERRPQRFNTDDPSQQWRAFQLLPNG